MTFMKRDVTLKLEENASQSYDKIVIKPYEQEDIGPHRHQFFELAYVTGGSVRHTLNGVQGTLGRGDYFIVDYGTEHSYQNSRNLTLINCLFLPESIDETLAGCKDFQELMQVCFIRYYQRYFSRVRTPVNRIFHDGDGRIRELLVGMQEEYKEKRIGYEEIFKSRLLEILTLTMRKIIYQDLERVEQAEQSGIILSAIQYFDAHFKEHTLLERFCREFHYSSQYMSRRFHLETGMTVLEYIQRVRVEKACEFIAGSDNSIQEIAAWVGYENVKYFNRVFQKLMHMSPGEYRRKAGGKGRIL